MSPFLGHVHSIISKCFKKRDRRKRLKKTNPSTFVPRCKINGKFKRVQCHNYKSNKKCWCVDTTSGKEIPGTRVRRGRPTCRQGNFKKGIRIKTCSMLPYAPLARDIKVKQLNLEGKKQTFNLLRIETYIVLFSKLNCIQTC